MCNGIYDSNETYNIDCASQYVGVTQQDYSFLMGISGVLFGSIMTVMIVWAVLNTGKSWRI